MKIISGVKKVFKDVRRRCARAALSLLFRPLPEQRHRPGMPASIILFCQEKLGDAILFTPLVAHLRRSLPECSITLLAFGNASADFFSNDPNVTAVYNVKKRRAGLLATLRRQRFDLLYSPKDHLSFSSVFFARALRARVRIGMDHPLHRGFFNHLLASDFHRPVIEKNCLLLDYLGIPFSKHQCEPYLPPHTLAQEIASFLESASLSGAVGINLSAGEPDREWPLDRYAALLREIDLKTVIFATQRRLADKRTLEAQFPRVIPIPPTPTIFDAAAIMSRLVLMVSPDTALVHVAACVKVPVVVLYRADKDHYTRFSPHQIPHRSILSPTHRIEDIPASLVILVTRALLKELQKDG